MPQNTHIELGRAEVERLHEPAKKGRGLRELSQEKAEELSANLAWLPNVRSSAALPERCRAAGKTTETVARRVGFASAASALGRFALAL